MSSLQLHHHSLERLIAQILFSVFVRLGKMNGARLRGDFGGLTRFIDHPKMLISQVDQNAAEPVLGAAQTSAWRERSPPARELADCRSGLGRVSARASACRARAAERVRLHSSIPLQRSASAVRRCFRSCACLRRGSSGSRWRGPSRRRRDRLRTRSGSVPGFKVDHHAIDLVLVQRALCASAGRSPPAPAPGHSRWRAGSAPPGEAQAMPASGVKGSYRRLWHGSFSYPALVTIKKNGPLAQRLEQRTHKLLSGSFRHFFQPLNFSYKYQFFQTLTRKSAEETCQSREEG